jgi:phenylacetate-CoA ligase
MDLYGPLLANTLFPLFEAARGRPTVPLLRYLRRTERWAVGDLRELQLGLLVRLLRHAYKHTAYYRTIMDERRLLPDDITTVSDLQLLPLLDRATVRATMTTRTSDAPPSAVIRKLTSGSSGQPVEVIYNAESRHWRDATRWRAYGWAGYRIGMRTLHYWGAPPVGSTTWLHRRKMWLDHRFKRDVYVDSTPRSEDTLAEVAAAIAREPPRAMVAYASGAAALARLVNQRGLRAWEPFPVVTGAEALVPRDRAEIERAFGPAFDSYGCREVMTIGMECEQHDGLHTSMETMLVELIVREPGGELRPAAPGEVGEVVITDLHNLACPMIRYVNGDLGIARGDEPCPCGRGLVKLGSIEGRTTDTLYDGLGRPVGGLVFNVLFAWIGHITRDFQVVQRADHSVVLRAVPTDGHRLPPREEERVRAHVERYLPGVPFSIELVDRIPLTPAGKHRVVVVEPQR